MADFNVTFEELNSQIPVAMSESQQEINVQMSDNIVGTTDWNEIRNKPDTFPPSSHTHGWNEVTDKPTEFTPAAHSHSWNSVTDKPTEFPPSSHNHSWESVTGKPSYYPPSAHGHGWSAIQNKPETFPPSEHNHDDRYYTEAEIDSKIGDVVSAINAIRGV